MVLVLHSCCCRCLLDPDSTFIKSIFCDFREFNIYMGLLRKSNDVSHTTFFEIIRRGKIISISFYLFAIVLFSHHVWSHGDTAARCFHE